MDPIDQTRERLNVLNSLAERNDAAQAVLDSLLAKKEQVSLELQHARAELAGKRAAASLAHRDEVN